MHPAVTDRGRRGLGGAPVAVEHARGAEADLSYVASVTAGRPRHGSLRSTPARGRPTVNSASSSPASNAVPVPTPPDGRGDGSSTRRRSARVRLDQRRRRQRTAHDDRLHGRSRGRRSLAVVASGRAAGRPRRCWSSSRPRSLCTSAPASGRSGAGRGAAITMAACHEPDVRELRRREQAIR